MKAIVIAVLSVLVLAGCEQQSEDGLGVLGGGDPTLDRQIIESTFACQQRDAILSQHTLYPHHFQDNSPKLNELGQNELAVLAEAYAANPGPLSIRRGQTNDGLYRQRVQMVMDSLRCQGVDTAKVTVSDGLPGGEGISSDDAALAIEASHMPVGGGDSEGIPFDVVVTEGDE